jgi:hypothetical protein
MPALEGISGYATHPAGTFTALTMNGSDSLAIRSFDISGTIRARLLAMWSYTQVIGNFRLRSPRLHDNVQGIRLRTQGKVADPLLWGNEFQQPLFAQDTLIGEINAPTDAAGNLEIGCALIYYENLPGVSASLISPAQLRQLGVHVIGQDVPITAGGGGSYTGSAAINSSVDNFIANQWYALVGVSVDTACAAVRIQGADIGNLGVLVPGAVNTPSQVSRWFVFLSEWYGLPLIPCFNSANKAGIFVSVAQDQGGAAVNCTLHMVLLQGTPNWGK